MTTIEGLYTMKEAAEYLGISHAMLMTYVSRQKRLRGVMVGRSMLFSKQALDEFNSTRRTYNRKGQSK